MVQINNDGSIVCDERLSSGWCGASEGNYCWNCPLLKIFKK